MTDAERSPAPTDPTDPAPDDEGMVEDVGNEAIIDAPLYDGSDDSGTDDVDDLDPALTGTNRDPGAGLDSQGVPAYAETESPGDPDDPGPVPEPSQPVVPNPDEPSAAMEWGTTAQEQFDGEPLDLKLAREEPDVGVGPAEDEDTTFDTDDSERGTIVQPDEGAHGDVDAEEFGVLVERSEADLPAEEAAIHVEPER